MKIYQGSYKTLMMVVHRFKSMKSIIKHHYIVFKSMKHHEIHQTMLTGAAKHMPQDSGSPGAKPSDTWTLGKHGDFMEISASFKTLNLGFYHQPCAKMMIFHEPIQT